VLDGEDNTVPGAVDLRDDVVAFCFEGVIDSFLELGVEIQHVGDLVVTDQCLFALRAYSR
jgi:hypothetical protein